MYQKEQQHTVELDLVHAFKEEFGELVHTYTIEDVIMELLEQYYDTNT